MKKILCPGCSRPYPLRDHIRKVSCPCGLKLEFNAHGLVICHGETKTTRIPPSPRPACIHRGDVVRMESCPTCSGSVEFKIFRCDLYGECALTGKTSVRNCGTCGDYSRYKPGTIRVGFVSPCFFFPGGVEEWIISLASRLASDGTAACSGLAVVDPKVSPINVARIAPIAPVIIGPESAKVLADESDVLIIWGIGNLNNILPGARCKTILALHGTSKWTGDFAKATGPLVDAVVGVSETAGSLWPGARVIPNGVDLSRCVPAESERGSLRASWGLGPGDKALGYVGRLVHDKDPLAIARAVQVLGPNWKAIYCGNNPEGLLGQAEKMIPGRVVHIPPTVHIAPILGSLDCMMVVSAHEGFCLALVEAWAAGVPTVCTPIGGVPEAEKRFGQIVHRVKYQASGEELARAVRQATGGGFATGVIARAQEAATRYYNADRMAKDWLKLIHELCGATSCPSAASP